MNSTISLLDTEGNIKELTSYSLNPKDALIAYYMQQEKKNYSTWDYPKELDNIKERKSGKGYYYTQGNGNIIVSTIKS